MTNFSDGEKSNLDGLYWTAFCYVADELPPNLQRAFELRLAHDQVAREAVETVMAQMQNLNVALEPPTHRVGYDRSLQSKRLQADGDRISKNRRSYILTATLVASIVLIGFFLVSPMQQLAPMANSSLDREPFATGVDLKQLAAQTAAVQADPASELQVANLWVDSIRDWNFDYRSEEHDDFYDEAYPYEFLDDSEELEFFTFAPVEESHWMIEAFSAAAEDDDMDSQPLSWQGSAQPHLG